jgi:hypothetical protein
MDKKTNQDMHLWEGSGRVERMSNGQRDDDDDAAQKRETAAIRKIMFVCRALGG